MENSTPPNTDKELSREEEEILDTKLMEMDLLYKSRCVKMPGGSNVTIREIDDKKE